MSSSSCSELKPLKSHAPFQDAEDSLNGRSPASHEWLVFWVEGVEVVVAKGGSMAWASVAEKVEFLTASRAEYNMELSVSGRALSKHPHLIGAAKASDVLPFASEQNLIGESIAEFFIKNGKRTSGPARGRGGLPWIDYTVPGKGAVRFNSVTKKFIGFRRA